MNTPALTVYGSKVSYFTGKLEAYLRFKEIPYQYQPMTVEYFNRIVPEKTGAQQMPAMEFPDGRWATDTSPIIDWFESKFFKKSLYRELCMHKNQVFMRHIFKHSFQQSRGDPFFAKFLHYSKSF